MKKSFKKAGVFSLDLLVFFSPLAIAVVVGSILAGGYNKFNSTTQMYIAYDAAILAFILWAVVTYLMTKLRRSWRYATGMLAISFVLTACLSLIERYETGTAIILGMLLIFAIASLITGWSEIKNWTYHIPKKR